MTYIENNSRSVTFVGDRLLFQHHLNELHQSSIDDGIIDLNFRSLIGDEPKEHLFCRLSPEKRLNNGRVNSSTLHNYQNTEAGGYWISGLNPHNAWQPWDYGRFKPDMPVISTKSDKPIKYISPPNGGYHPIYLDVPQHIWDKVAQRYHIKRCHSDCLSGRVKPVPFLPTALQSTTKEPSTSNTPYSFWSWVKAHPEIPVILTEGEKKAACLLSLGFVAISLPGVWMGRVKNKETETEYLHPDLLPLVETGRKFVIMFDNDPKPSTKKKVNMAIERTAKVIEKAGATCEVALLPDDSEKGVDDFVFANGGESAASLIAQIINAALTLEKFIRHIHPKNWGLSSKYPPNLKINTDRISEVITNFPDSGLVVLWSGMGTGKTYLLEKRQELYPNERFLNVGHRVNLLQNLSNRLKTDIYSEISLGNLAKSKRLSITLDSLYKIKTDYLRYDCVFIDEACQNLAHLLHSKTCKEHREEIFKVLEYFVNTAKLVVLADAHMDDLTVDFFRRMRPEREVPFIIHNQYQPGDRKIYLYNGNDSSALIEKVMTAMMLNLKIMVVSDSKKFIKKIELMLISELGKNVEIQEDKDKSTSKQKLRVWSIHGDNSGSDENRAFIKDISAAVNNVDILLTSPSLGTGVDIKGDRFEAVFGAFHAVSQSATECAQQLHRFRKAVPIHLWISPYPPYGYQETDAEKIKSKMLNSNEMTAFLTRINIDKATGIRGAEKDWVLDAYCQIEAKRRRSINNLREDLQDLLTEMDYNLSVVSTETDSVAKTIFKEASQKLDTTRTLTIINAQDISEKEYQTRQTKDYLSPDEMTECEKYRLKTFYGKSVTKNLVERDNGGRLYGRLLTFEAVAADSPGEIINHKTGAKYPAPPLIVAQRDLRERENFAFCMDWHNYSSQWLALYILGLPKLLTRLLAGEEICATDPDLVKMKETAINSRIYIKALLNLTIPKDCKPLWLMGTLLDRLGLKTVSFKRGKRGRQITYRHLSQDETKFALEFLEYRERLRQQKEERQRQIQSEKELSPALITRQYGIHSSLNPVSPPPLNGVFHNLEAGEDTEKIKEETLSIPPLETWKVFSGYYKLVEDKIDQGIDLVNRMTKGGIKQVSLLYGALNLLAQPINLILLE